HRVYDVDAPAHVPVQDPAAPRVQIADDRARAVFRGHHLDLHDRLEQHRATIAQALAHRRTRGDFEGERRGIDFVVAAVDQRHLEIDHREAGKHARTEHGLDALLDARDVFLRYVAADDLALEL